MKMFVLVNSTGSGKSEDDAIRPDLPKYIVYSGTPIDDKFSKFVCRITFKEVDRATISDLLSKGKIVALSDDEALNYIKMVNPDSDLENLDVVDIEVDEIAKKLKIDPDDVRRLVKKPTIGKVLLQDQEKEVLKVISEKLGLTKDYWDQEAKKEGYKDGKELEDELKRGKNKAHEVILDRIKKKLGGV